MRRTLMIACLIATATAFAQELPRRGVTGLPLTQTTEEARVANKLDLQSSLTLSADSGGLKAGDIIVEVGGSKFNSTAKYVELTRGYTDKSSMPVTYLRDGKRQEATIKIIQRPNDDTDKYTTIYTHVTSGKNRIRVIITKPKSAGKHPVLYWIQGIGLGSIDFPLSANNVTAPIMNSFAQDDYVTVRVEKPGVGDSEGGPARLVGWNEENDIYKQALKSFDKYDFIDRDNVFIFGHSMGGCHAPVVVAEQPVKGVISYGTVSASWLEWAVKAPRIQGILSGQKHSDVDTEVRNLARFYSYLYTEDRSIDWIKQNAPDLKTFAEEQSPDGVMLGDRSIQYMKETNKVNYADFWSKLGKTKVLALYGEHDWIALRDDQVFVAEMVNKANPGMAEFVTVPSSDHLFYQCTSPADSFSRFGKPGNVANSAVIDTMKKWIGSLK